MKRIFLVGLTFTAVFILSFCFFSRFLQARQRKDLQNWQKSLIIPAPEVNFPHESWQQNYDRLRRAIDLTTASEPRYADALALFEENIRDFPKARDLDFCYAWGALCHAQLGHWEECLTFYRIVRERFPGYQEGGASGAVRLWDGRLVQVKSILASSGDSLAGDFLTKMAEIDQHVATTGAFLAP